MTRFFRQSGVQDPLGAIDFDTMPSQDQFAARCSKGRPGVK